MNAKDALDSLKAETWAQTPAMERLHLLENVRERLWLKSDELADADAAMKNSRIGENLFSRSESKVATVVPMANTLSACVELYQDIVHGDMPQPHSITEVADGIYEIHVAPTGAKDRMLNGDRHDVIRVIGEPRQVNPMDKPPGIIAVLGAGNYSSSLEMAKAMFLENKAVVHKPHHLNINTDKVWAEIFAPLIEVGAVAFVEDDPDRILTSDERINKIYFTGGTATAQSIMANSAIPLVSECGGNNPCIIVPGDRPWTDKELAHQAVQIATIGKLNGGAVCGRLQTMVTSKHWPQREAFLDALRKAISEDTPAAGSYYPGSEEVRKEFEMAYPEAEVLKPEHDKHQSADFLLIPGCAEDSFASSHEAFCQIINEVPLDVEANANAFLPAATQFCNDKLLGTLGCAILIDEDSKKTHQKALDNAVTDLRYGGIAINTIPPFVFLSPYLTWGGNEADGPFVSGQGNFGNLYCYENVEKSIISAGFTSMGHMMRTNQHDFDSLSENMSRYSCNPSWVNLSRLMGGAVVGGFHGKDF